MEFRIGKTKIYLRKGDITDQRTDAIVNAANPGLLGGGGVDGAIHRKGGPKIYNECKKIRETIWPKGLPVGKAVMTKGGSLKAKFVIHTVGPIWRGGNHGEEGFLSEAYRNCLKIANDKNLKSVSFPSISTGAYGYPKEQACRVALLTVKDYLKKREDGVEEVYFVLFSDVDLAIYGKASEEIMMSEGSIL
jgi:O-acetyl-ADP-ribose deacetylase (regulator of RNase III)